MIMDIVSSIRRVRTRLWLLWMIAQTAALVVAPSVSAHEKPSEKEVWAFRTNLRPTIDGVLDDADWKRVTPATGFILIEPEEGVAATNQTFIHVLYDADYLYNRPQYDGCRARQHKGSHHAAGWSVCPAGSRWFLS